jgi:hypothetical protein
MTWVPKIVTSASWIPLKQIPFPALTICPVRDSRWLGVANILKDVDKSEHVFNAFEDLPDEVRSIMAVLIKDKVKKTTKLKNAWGKTTWLTTVSVLVKNNDAIKGLCNQYLDTLYTKESLGKPKN